MNKNLQDFILNKIRKDNIQVTVFLLNGSQVLGFIKGFDNYVIILEADGKVQMVYKHAVSSIIPMEALSNLNINTSEDLR